MKKHLRLPMDIELTRYPGQTVLTVLFDPEALRDWCLGLCLLKESLAEALIVSEERGEKKFELRMMETSNIKTRIQAKFANGMMQLKITPGDLDYLLHFFLRYYRDGVAEVDHVDLQGVSVDDEEESYITFMVPEFIPPVNAEEAMRRLGLG